MTPKRLLSVAAALLIAAVAFWLWSRDTAPSAGPATDATEAAGAADEAAPGLPLETVTIEERRHSLRIPTKPATESEANRPGIPSGIGHPFRR